MKKIFLYSITAMLLFSCQKSNLDGANIIVLPIGVAASTQQNIAYGTDPLQKFVSPLYRPPKIM